MTIDDKTIKPLISVELTDDSYKLHLHKETIDGLEYGIFEPVMEHIHTCLDALVELRDVEYSKWRGEFIYKNSIKHAENNEYEFGGPIIRVPEGENIHDIYSVWARDAEKAYSEAHAKLDDVIKRTYFLYYHEPWRKIKDQIIVCEEMLN
jgi:hypothetical protein